MILKCDIIRIKEIYKEKMELEKYLYKNKIKT